MVKQFLKMAGARNEKEFLSMFPTEESFFRAYPQAKQMANPQFGAGGMMMDGPGKKRKKPAQQYGAVPSDYIQYIDGQPVAVDFASSPQGNISEYLDLVGMDPSYANREQIARRLNIPNYSGTAAQNIGMYNTLQNTNMSKWPYSFAQPVKQEYGGGMYHYAPGGDVQGGPGGPIMPGTLDAAVRQTILDQSAASGIPPLLARPAPEMVGPVIPPQYAQYAQAPQAAPTYQGVSIIDMLNNAGLPSDKTSRKAMAEARGIKNYTGTAAQNRQLIETLGGNWTGGGGQGSSGGRGGSGARAADNRAAAASDNSSSQGTTPVPVQDANGNWVMPALGLAGATGATIYGMNKFGNAKYGKWSEADIYINRALKEGRTSDLFNILKDKYKMPVVEINKRLKGAKFYNAGANITGLTEGVNVLKGDIAKKADEIVNAMKTQGYRQPNLVKQLSKLVGDPIEAAKMMKGIPLSAKTAKPVQAVVAGANTVANTAKTSGTWGDAFKAGTMALKEAPLFKFLRKAPKAYGGEQMAYGGMYDDGGMYAYGGVSGQNPYPGVYEDGYSGTSSVGNYFPQGGTFIPEPMMMPGQLPEYGYGKAMYGAGMAEGGQMPQWLAERRFSAAGNQSKMGQYGYADGGSYTKGSVHDMDEDQIQELVNQGYKIEYI